MRWGIFCDDAASAAGQKPMAFAWWEVGGSCAQKNDSGDLFVFTPTESMPYFWDLSSTRRQNHLLIYLGIPRSPPVWALFEDYLRLMPEYQGVEITQLQLQGHCLFSLGRQSRDHHGAVLPVGDSSGNQSLELWGFGAMVRHLSVWNSRGTPN